MPMQFKSIPLDGVQLKLDGETRRFKGYASTFNGNDEYGDTILPGAYTKTLKDFGLPKMFFGHNLNSPQGIHRFKKNSSNALIFGGNFFDTYVCI